MTVRIEGGGHKGKVETGWAGWGRVGSGWHGRSLLAGGGKEETCKIETRLDFEEGVNASFARQSCKAAVLAATLSFVLMFFLAWSSSLWELPSARLRTVIVSITATFRAVREVMRTRPAGGAPCVSD